MDEIVKVKEQEMNEIANNLSRTSNKIMNMPDSLNKDFSNITSTGLLKKSVDLIGKQITQIRESIDNTKKAVKKTYDDFTYVENSLKTEAEKINNPMDFVKNDSSYLTNKISISLNKDDGTAVKSENGTEKEELDFNKALEYNEGLNEIVKEYEYKNGEIEIKLNKKDLYSIKNDYTDKKQLIDDIEIEKANLKYLDGQESIVVEVDEKNEKQKQNLKKINSEIAEEHPRIDDLFDLNYTDNKSHYENENKTTQ